MCLCVTIDIKSSNEHCLLHREEEFLREETKENEQTFLTSALVFQLTRKGYFIKETNRWNEGTLSISSDLLLLLSFPFNIQ
jgi:hypothetical protein